ncbi:MULTISPECIES: EpsG family protein [Thermotoga]|uniref:EpsG family protein n=1 Tax=Thermotoga petrophila (strain ATCC BAA-488 / DSM 13995 / JCM 10881 / RKU-1) TaxID=390874 RepID=A5IJF4_THEP1|nr:MULTISPECIES: EpsG family protein [Thermotoga]ABQ46327.1 hypothetical protein Tpet_0298 [Thermotoga petrophila RKU-1]KAF2959883.1 hypothetical protein AS158_05415 [Thermotoga sp. 38H-to]
MFWYIFIFLVIASTLFLSYQYKFDRKTSVTVRSLLFILLVLFIGLRHEVGGDWFGYLDWFRRVSSGGLTLSFEDIFLKDFGYNLFNWLSSKIGWGIYGVNLLCASIFLIGLFAFLDYLGNDRGFYLGLLVSYPYLIMVVANGYTRQSVALGLIMLSYSLFLKERYMSSFLCQMLAFFFHKTSAIGFIIFLFHRKTLKWILPLILAILAIAFSFFGQLFVRYYALYVENPMYSEGGTIRAVMNLVPALIFIVLFRYFERRYPDSKFWLIISVIVLILSIPSILKFTFADRLLLYFSMIQPLVFVRLEYVLKEIEVKAMLFISIIFVYCLAMTVWLLFAKHAPYWIPYKNLILKLLE